MSKRVKHIDFLGQERDPRSISETELLHAVIDLVEASGWLWFHEWDSRRKPYRDSNANGFPDLVMVDDGDVYYVELKRHYGKLRPEQAAWRDRLLEARAHYGVWRPADWPYILKWVTGDLNSDLAFYLFGKE